MHRLKQWLGGWRPVGILAIVAALAWLALLGLRDGQLHVHFLDVGQGDAILIQTPDGRQILVDGGPDPTALLGEIGEILPFWDHTLDLVVLTHPDADHVTGLIAVLDRYRVAELLDTPEVNTTPEAASWFRRLTEAHITRRLAQRGMRLPMGDLTLTVLNPGPTPLADPEGDVNNSAMVLRLDYGQTSLLLTSDIEEPAEADLQASGLPLRADVLKVGHHGSSTSTSAGFLAAVAPRLAVIQVGENLFGHPHPDVLKRLAGVQVLRTDRDGRVEVVSDGKRLWVKTTRGQVER